MSTQTSLIFACYAMVLLVVLVSIRLIYFRVKEPRAKRIHPQQISNSKQTAELLTLSTTTADNYRNLFELPVLFYLLCVLAIVLKIESPVLTYGAWVFVVLRYTHSFIHCTYNKVMHRFPVFVLGFITLVALWNHLIRTII